jgi:hypothetical protein
MRPRDLAAVYESDLGSRAVDVIEALQLGQYVKAPGIMPAPHERVWLGLEVTVRGLPPMRRPKTRADSRIAYRSGRRSCDSKKDRGSNSPRRLASRRDAVGASQLERSAAATSGY